jgi:hypothetical protein
MGHIKAMAGLNLHVSFIYKCRDKNHSTLYQKSGANRICENIFAKACVDNRSISFGFCLRRNYPWFRGSCFRGFC